VGEERSPEGSRFSAGGTAPDPLRRAVNEYRAIMALWPTQQPYIAPVTSIDSVHSEIGGKTECREQNALRA